MNIHYTVYTLRVYPRYRIEPEIDISVRIRNNIIYVKPKQSWPNQFTIFISRNLSDYNNNKLTHPIQPFFSLTDSIKHNEHHI